MLKRIFALLTVLLLAVSLLASCSFLDRFKPGGGDTVDGGNTGDTEEPENLIFNKTSELYIIADPMLESDFVSQVYDKLMEFRENVVNYAAVDSPAHDHEIVIGNTDRPISKTAKSRLERIDKSNDDERIFLIYTDGSSIAVVWDEDEDNIVRDMAIKFLCENYLGDELITTSKVLKSETVNLYDYYTAKDEAFKAPLWENFEKNYGKELTTAYRQLYSIYSENCIVWLANLYDPDICVCVDLYGEEECSGTKYCGTGGWYYSNSARDTMGYLPDAESTNQALNFLVSAGLASQRDGKYLSVITEEMKKQIGDFVYALEEPNGYFYHPQWGIEFTDTKISRRARDLNWCCNMLTTLGRTPKYTTASGMKGEDAVEAAAPITGGLGMGTVLSVSKVVALSGDSYASHLQNLDSFKAYLDGLDLRNRSYHVGNELTSQTAQIQARDKQIGTDSDPTPLMDYLIDWLNKGQNPETGNWDWKKPGDPGYSAYYGTNGLLKISGIYTAHKVVMPYAREAALSATADITNSAPISAVVDLYNTWFAIRNVIENMRTNGTDADKAEADAIVAELRSIAPNAVRVSTEKIADFLKPDGSASYTKLYSSATSQGCPAAVPNSIEGDVNGSTIAINGIIGNSTLALEVDKVPLLGEAARYLFRKEIANLSPVNKADYNTTAEPIDFEYDDIGAESEDLTINHNGGRGTALVIADPTGSGKGNVTEIKSYNGIGDSIRIPNQANGAFMNTYIFEGDFYISSVTTDYPIQITLGSCYMLTVRVKNGELQLWESSSGNGTLSMDEYLGVKPERGKWFRLKVEYYYGTEDSVRIKVYCDTDLSDGTDMKLYAVTDNYYDPNGEKVLKGTGTPSSSFDNTHIYIMSSAEAEIYVDNLMSYRSKQGYSEVNDPNNQPYVNIDCPPSDRVVYDFADGSINEDIKTTINNSAIKVDSDGKLAVSGAASTSSITIPMTIREKGSKCGFASFKLNVASANVGEEILMLTAKDDTLDIFSFRLLVKEDINGKYLTLQPKGAVDGAVMDSVRIPIGEEVTLSFEYYHAEDVIIVYVDGKFVGASTSLYSNANKYTMDSLLVSTTAGKTFSLTLDDIVVERIVADFADAVAPNVSDKIFGFDAADDEAVITGSGTTISGGKLNMNASSGKQSLTIPANKRANIVNSAFLRLDIDYTKTAPGTAHILKLSDKAGNVIISFELVCNGTKIELYEVGAGGRLSNPVYTYDAAKTVSLKIEIFVDQKIIYIYDGESVKAKSSIIVGEAYLDSGFASFTVESGSAKTEAKLDNARFETLYSIYKNVNVSGAVNPEKDLTAGLTFESSNTGSLPAPFVTKLYNSNFYTVQNVFNDVIGKFSNVFSFTKDSSGNDELIMGTNKLDSSASCITFEADMKLDFSSDGCVFRMYFGEDGRQNSVYYLQPRVSGETIVFEEVSNAGNGDNISHTVKTSVKQGEWFNFKLEFYKGTRDTVRFKLYINGECIAVSNTFAGSHSSSATPSSSLSSVCFYFMGATRGNFYMDNISLTSSNATSDDAVTVGK